HISRCYYYCKTSQLLFEFFDKRANSDLFLYDSCTLYCSYVVAECHCHLSQSSPLYN
ncbi:hypothetical protein C2G38_2070585, partial [Gigaspora rosea]